MAHVIRPLEIAKVLRPLGYEVIFAGDGLAMNLARKDGFQVMPLPELDFKWIAEHFYEGPEALHPIERVENWVSAELALYNEVQPDVVLDDFRLTASISTGIAGLPHVCLTNAHMIPYSVRGLLHGSPNGVPSFIGPGSEVSYNQVRDKYTMAPVKSLIDMFPGSLNLLCDVPEYAPTKDLPKNFHYVGPITWNSNLEAPAWLDRLDQNQPVIYLTMGSTGLPQAFQVGIEALKESEYQVIITLGSMVKIEDFGPVPDNIFLAQFGPGEVFSKIADVVICHAGNGTAYQVLGAGKPIVALPFSVDQQWQAKRQAELGLGVTVKELTTAALMDAVSEVLENKTYYSAAEQYRKILEKYNGPKRSAELIQEMIGAS